MTPNVAPGRRLTPEQQKALEALASGATKQQAAMIAGRTLRTLERWYHDPAFQAALREVTGAAVEDAARRTATTLNQALTVLLVLMGSKDAPPAVRLRAADLIIVHAVKMRELSELEERLTKLEVRLADEP